MINCIDVSSCKLGACLSKEYSKLISSRAESTYNTQNFKYDPIPNLGELFEFDQLFEKFMQNDLPFKNVFQSVSASDQELKINYIIAQCLSYGAEATGSGRKGLEISIFACINKHLSKDDSVVLMKHLKLPALLSSNYLSRTNITTHNNCAAGGAIDFLQHWPVVQLLSANIPSVSSQCPSDMHTVLWGQDMPIKIRLFDTRMSSSVGSYFQYSNHYLDIPYYERFLNANVGGSTVTQPDALIHFPSFKRSGFPKYEESAVKEHSYVFGDAGITNSNFNPNLSFPRFQEVVLEPREYLFVPHHYIISGLYLNEDKSASVSVFKHCFVDASNFITVKRKLDEESHGYCQAHQISQAFRNGLGFDVTMDRNPQELTLGQYASGYYATGSGSDAANDAALGGVETNPMTAEKESEAPSAPAPAAGSNASPKARGGRNRNKKKSGATSDTASSSASSRGASIREWQVTKKWNMLITSLTLPPPYLPQVYRPDVLFRSSVKLYWHTPFRPSTQESTKFGFNVTLCDVTTDDCLVYTLFRDTRLNDGSELVHINTLTTIGSDGAVNSVETRGIALKETIDKKRSAATGEEIYQYNVMLKHLQPDTTYKYRMTIFYDQSESNPSEWSNAHVQSGPPDVGVIVTLPYSAPSVIPHVLEEPMHSSATGVYYGLRNEYIHAVQMSYSSVILIYPKPTDTGGHNVLGYNIYLRYISTPELMHHHPREISRLRASIEGSGSDNSTGTGPVVDIHFNRMNEHMNNQFFYHDTVVLERDDAYHRNMAGDFIRRYREGHTKSYLSYLEDTNYNVHIVQDILPMTSIDFRISSFNVLGSSGPSFPSQPLHMHGHLDVDDAGLLLGREFSKHSVYGVDYKLVANRHPSLLRGKNNDVSVADGLTSLHQLVIQSRLSDRDGDAKSFHMVDVDDIVLPGNLSVLFNFVAIDEHKQTLSMVVSADRIPSNQHRYKLDGDRLVDQYVSNPLEMSSILPSVEVVVHEGWGVHYTPRLSRMTFGSVVLSLPDLTLLRQEHKLSGSEYKYSSDLATYSGRIVLSVRGGGIPLVMKILSIQEAGGIGAIIVDDGSCALDSSPSTSSSAAPLTIAKKKKGKKTKRSLSSKMSSTVAPSASGGSNGWRLLEYDQKCIAGASKYAGERIGVNDIATPWLKVKIPVLFVTREVGSDLLSATTIPLPPYLLEEGTDAVPVAGLEDVQMWREHAKQFLLSHVHFLNRTETTKIVPSGPGHDEL